jgi:hypothetical protein
MMGAVEVAHGRQWGVPEFPKLDVKALTDDGVVLYDHDAQPIAHCPISLVARWWFLFL